MAQCADCGVNLEGSWKEKLDPSESPNTRRCLGINDGYFCGGPGWVCCFCSPCYTKKILQLAVGFKVGLSFDITRLESQKSSLLDGIHTLAQKIKDAEQELTDLECKKSVLGKEISNLQQEKCQQIALQKSITTSHQDPTAHPPTNQITPSQKNRITTSQNNQIIPSQNALNTLKTNRAIQLLYVLEDFSCTEAQLVQFPSFVQQMSTYLESATSQFFLAEKDRLLKQIEHIIDTLSKELRENEVALEMILNMQIPEAAKSKMLGDIKNRISSLKDQSARWNYHIKKVLSL